MEVSCDQTLGARRMENENENENMRSERNECNSIVATQSHSFSLTEHCTSDVNTAVTPFTLDACDRGLAALFPSMSLRLARPTWSEQLA